MKGVDEPNDHVNFRFSSDADSSINHDDYSTDRISIGNPGTDRRASNSRVD
jgi:hypothetical protein